MQFDEIADTAVCVAAKSVVV